MQAVNHQPFTIILSKRIWISFDDGHLNRNLQVKASIASKWGIPNDAIIRHKKDHQTCNKEFDFASCNKYFTAPFLVPAKLAKQIVTLPSRSEAAPPLIS